MKSILKSKAKNKYGENSHSFVPDTMVNKLGGEGDTYTLYTYYNIVQATHFHKLRGGSSGWYKMKVFGVVVVVVVDVVINANRFSYTVHVKKNASC